MPTVLVEDLRCEGPAGRVTLALPQLAIDAGERVAIVGANGAGKSTLLRCLAGFAQPVAGRLRVLDRELRPVPDRTVLRGLRADIGQVLQGLHLVQRLSAIDNVLIGALGRQRGWRSWARCPGNADRAEAQRALDAVGLAGRADERADRLSGGERQKVAIARLLMQRPRLVLADEPTASLDPNAAREVCALLGRAAEGRTLVTVVHDTALLPQLADRVIGLRAGRLAFDRPLKALQDADLAALYAPGDPAPESAPRPCPDGTGTGTGADRRVAPA